MKSKDGPVLMVSKAPDDPKEHEDWVKQMVRLQIAMLIDDDGAKRAFCHVPYSSVDNFLARNPKRGQGNDQFVDSTCWPNYELLILRLEPKDEKK